MDLTISKTKEFTGMQKLEAKEFPTAFVVVFALFMAAIVWRALMLMANPPCAITFSIYLISLGAAISAAANIIRLLLFNKKWTVTEDAVIEKSLFSRKTIRLSEISEIVEFRDADCFLIVGSSSKIVIAPFEDSDFKNKVENWLSHLRSGGVTTLPGAPCFIDPRCPKGPINLLLTLPFLLILLFSIQLFLGALIVSVILSISLSYIFFRIPSKIRTIAKQVNRLLTIIFLGASFLILVRNLINLSIVKNPLIYDLFIPLYMLCTFLFIQKLLFICLKKPLYRHWQKKVGDSLSTSATPN